MTGLNSLGISELKNCQSKLLTVWLPPITLVQYLLQLLLKMGKGCSTTSPMQFMILTLHSTFWGFLSLGVFWERWRTSFHQQQRQHFHSIISITFLPSLGSWEAQGVFHARLALSTYSSSEHRAQLLSGFPFLGSNISSWCRPFCLFIGAFHCHGWSWISFTLLQGWFWDKMFFIRMGRAVENVWFTREPHQMVSGIPFNKAILLNWPLLAAICTS